MRRLVVVLALLVFAAPALAHEGNPDFESLITGVQGVGDDLSAQVVNGDDSLLLINRGSQPVVVIGYEDEPYARLRPDGVVEVNENSTATYLNEDRYQGSKVPAGVDPRAEPKWKVVARNGRFTFHDHRIHWMNENDPPKLADESKRQKVFDWKVPVQEGDAKGQIAGTLFWRGKDDGAPLGAYIAGALLLVLSAVFVVVVRRRRRATDAPAGTPAAPREEAW
jgi:hypothetical protein